MASQYFVNPQEDSSSPLSIAGLVKKKRNVTAVPKNSGDNSAAVKPATPLQVALYYKEEAVLFLLLNHFLKICNGNVSRCYDETAEAIANVNGYSHLMDFFQYYDCIARDSFGACWTEAMRHICDLTTKLNKYRRHNGELLAERDAALKGRDQAVLERDSITRDRVVVTKGALEHKEATIQRLQHALADREQAVETLARQVDTLRGTLHQITGAGSLDGLRRARWDFRVVEGGNVRLTASSEAEVGDEVGDNCAAPVLTDSPEREGPGAGVDAMPTTAVVRECMHHHAGLGVRLRHLADYVAMCRHKNAGLRAQTPSLVEAVQSQSRWECQPAAPPDLHAECGLSVGPDDLYIFDNGDDVQAMGHLLRGLEFSSATAPAAFGGVAQGQVESARRIQGLLTKHQITNESGVRTLDVLMAHLEKVVSAESVPELVADVDARLQAATRLVEECAREKARGEATGVVALVEREMVRQMDAQRRLLDLGREKLDRLDAKANEMASLSAAQEVFARALEDLQATTSRRLGLAQLCEADQQAIQAALRAQEPRLRQLEEDAAAAAAEFQRTVDANDAAQEAAWETLIAAFTELQRLQDERAATVTGHLEGILSWKRREREHSSFRLAAHAHERLLAAVRAKCEGAQEVGYLIAEIVMAGQETIREWGARSTGDLETVTLAAHQQMAAGFRDWYLTQGEYVHKKKMLLKDIGRKIGETQNRAQLAIQRLDASSEQHAAVLEQLEDQRNDLELNQIPRLEALAEAAMPLLETTREFLTRRGLPFVHPEGALAERNAQREHDIHAREVANYQVFLLASQGPPPDSPVAPLESGRRPLPDDPARLDSVSLLPQPATPKGREAPGGSELDQNRALKLRLQEYFVMVPFEYLDPITLEIIADPVVAGDGHTYERTSIGRWVQRKGTSPKTGVFFGLHGVAHQGEPEECPPPQQQSFTSLEDWRRCPSWSLCCRY